MCTVTLIPIGKADFILTSNRDEAPDRKSLDPDFYIEKGVNLLYPKDVLAGGTWIGVSEKKRMICLLNGGFTLHKRLAEYRLSRGIIVKDLLVASSFIDQIEKYNLVDVEPFTIVLVDWLDELIFIEFVWDGVAKHVSKLPLKPKIWSSSSLYTEEMKNVRLDWFEDYKANNELNPESILNFHKSAGEDNEDYGVIMDRGFVKTTSITQVEKHQSDIEMTFYNLQKDTFSKSNISFSKSIND
ncbi:NRDE family protein [Formosa maritima]|uniref:NRDE family protein n=1 Tax=Formosa maritima TaxID=2592046 RepID=A0A5D0G2X6_9FLAO|nr:NRDE family protein [Formosa maritima]TYA53185.1 NRDE family protein [Formosa maritima]